MDKAVELFKYRLITALNIRNMKPVELSKMLGVSRSTISQYMSGKVEPRTDKIEEISLALNVNPTWLMGYDVPMDDFDASKNIGTYYLDRKTADLANAYSTNPKLKMLFDAARYAEPDDIETAYSVLIALKKKEKRGSSDQ